jgi:all-trans-8'-apo-beta-carotenal 15,15'-oxygenase
MGLVGAMVWGDRMLVATLPEIWQRAHQCQTQEVDRVLEVQTGAIPSGLRGVHYRIGPGRLERGGVRYAHPFDGDGMVSRFAFSGGGVRYLNRYVRTEEFCAEESAGRMLYRSFGTNLPGGLKANAFRIDFKNAANTSLVHHAGKLLALWEGGLPHRLDPQNLETLDRHHFDGRLLDRGTLLRHRTAQELPFSAHPKIDPRTGELHNFGTRLGPRPKLVLYRIDASGRMDVPTTVALDRLRFIHDFALTPNYRVFLLAPIAFRVARMLTGLETPVGSIVPMQGGRGRVLLVPRAGGAPIFIPSSSAFVFHVANGYEDDDGRIVVDGTRWSEFPAFADLRSRPGDRVYQGDGPALTRFTIDPRRQSVSEERLCEHSTEFPVVNGRQIGVRHRFIWCNGAAPTFEEPGAATVIKVDTRSATSIARSFAPDLPAEPFFVPRPGATAEDDGWLLLTVYVSAHARTDLVVLDATDLSVVCRGCLPHHLPPGFHGTWVDFEQRQ